MKEKILCFIFIVFGIFVVGLQALKASDPELPMEFENLPATPEVVTIGTPQTVVLTLINNTPQNRKFSAVITDPYNNSFYATIVAEPATTPTACPVSGSDFLIDDNNTCDIQLVYTGHNATTSTLSQTLTIDYDGRFPLVGTLQYSVKNNLTPNQWQTTNGPVGGTINTIIQDPATKKAANPTLYSGGYGGVYKSTDGGITWAAANGSGANAISTDSIVTSLAFDSNHKLYAATRGFSTLDFAVVYVSSDGGSTWAEVGNLGAVFLPNQLVIDSSNNVYLGVQAGIYKFSGGSWSLFFAGSGTDIISTIAIDSTGVIYAGDSITNPTPPPTLLNSVLKCNPVCAQLGSNFTNPILSVVTDSTNTPYASTIDGVFAWNSSSWNSLNSLPSGVVANDLYFAPSDNNVYAATNLGVFQYLSSAWSPVVGTGSFNIPTNALVKDSSNTLHAGTAGQGIWEFTSQWVQTNTGLVATSSVDILATGNGIAIDKNHNVYVSTDAGVFKYDGTSWTAVNDGLPSINNNLFQIVSDNSGTGTKVYLATSAGVYLYTGTGSPSWTQITNTPTYTVSLVVDSTGILYAGTGTNSVPSNCTGVWKYESGSWTQMVTGLNTAFNVPNVAIDGSGNLYATNVNNVYQWNSPTANQWNKLVGTSPLPGYASTLGISSTGTLIAGTFLGHAISSSVSEWTGTSWTQIGSVPADTDVTSIVSDSQGVLYASFASAFTSLQPISGVYYFDTVSNTWVLANNGLTRTFVTTLAADSNNLIYAAPIGGGVFVAEGASK